MSLKSRVGFDKMSFEQIFQFLLPTDSLFLTLFWPLQRHFIANFIELEFWDQMFSYKCLRRKLWAVNQECVSREQASESPSFFCSQLRYFWGYFDSSIAVLSQIQSTLILITIAFLLNVSRRTYEPKSAFWENEPVNFLVTFAYRFTSFLTIWTIPTQFITNLT